MTGCRRPRGRGARGGRARPRGGQDSDDASRNREPAQPAASATRRPPIPLGHGRAMASIALTPSQRAEIDGQGWTVCERVLSGEALDRVSAAMDDVAAQKRALDGAAPGSGVSWRNGLARHRDLLELIDHEPVLARVVDIVGWNIANRDSIFVYTTSSFTPKYTASGLLAPDTSVDAGVGAGADSEELHLGWHFDYEEEFLGTTLDGRMPLLDLKASWLISDHSDPLSSTTLLVPGSFKWDAEQRATWQQWLDPAAIVEIRPPPGSVLLWRPTTLHAVKPHRSQNARKALHVSYGPRFLRQSIAHRADGHVAQVRTRLSLC